MITIRKSDDRGYADRGWLRSHATFSFGAYQDPRFNGFRALRVLNEDRIAPGKGFGPHSHRDMEILTYVVAGALAHRDSLSGPHVLGRNELQAMSAGDGIVHSEFNASDTEPSHSIQIWIDPVAEDLAPRYQQIAFRPEDAGGRLHLLAAPESSDPARTAIINQQARVYITAVGSGDQVTHTLAPGRHAWVQVVRGQVTVNAQALDEGDGAAISGESALTLAGSGEAGGELLLFDLA
jgi:redox-sensitive bicupin YhaK (pirin superfamily)